MLVKELTSLDINYDLQSNQFATISRRFQILANIFMFAHLGKEFTGLMIDKLATCSIDDLDQLLLMTKSMKEADDIQRSLI